MHKAASITVNIVYFGHLHDTLGCREEQIAWTGGDSSALLALLRARGGVWAQALQPDKIFRVAVNHVLYTEPVLIPDGAEVGILPPVTGG